MKNKKYILALILVLLSGCAPTVNPYNNVLNSWIGVPENELISRWGPLLGCTSQVDTSI